MNTLALWDSQPLACFSAFIRSDAFARTSRRPLTAAAGVLSDDSADTYLFMFGRFVAWMAEQQKLMSTIDQLDLRRFVERSTDGKRDLNSAIAYRYLRLLERCFEYLAVAPNPGTVAIREIGKRAFAADHRTAALGEAELGCFLTALPAAPAAAPGTGPSRGWKRRRDRAMQVVMALAGVKVAEAVGMLVEEVSSQATLDGAIEIQITPQAKHRTSFAHTTLLSPDGAAELLGWLEERRRLAIPGPLLFPANENGDALNKATVYRQVRATFERAGIDVSHAGGRTLRNTFAVQKLQAGASAGELAGYLGLARTDATDRYKHALLGKARKP